MIKHVNGNIFDSDEKVILHQVNCQGVMNSGVAKQVRERYPIVFDYYKAMCNDRSRNPKTIVPSPLLGHIQCVYVNDSYVSDGVNNERMIVNIFAQDEYGYSGKQYTSYIALEKCFTEANRVFAGQSIAMPYRIGCCRGGGDWSVVYKMIEDIFTDCDVTLYEYNGG